MLFYRVLDRIACFLVITEKFTEIIHHDIIYVITYCTSGAASLIEKTGEKPARSRRCKDESSCIYVTVHMYGKAQL